MSSCTICDVQVCEALLALLLKETCASDKLSMAQEKVKAALEKYKQLVSGRPQPPAWAQYNPRDITAVRTEDQEESSSVETASVDIGYAF